MDDLRDLYQEVILDHGKHPRNFHAMDDASHGAEGLNPLCGDRLVLYLKVENGVVASASFTGSGCAISTASASVMTEIVTGKTIDEIRRLFDRFKTMVTAPIGETPDTVDLGKLAVFAGVREFPVRVKCATLAWHTLEAALENASDPITTE